MAKKRGKKPSSSRSSGRKKVAKKTKPKATRKASSKAQPKTPAKKPTKNPTKKTAKKPSKKAGKKKGLKASSARKGKKVSKASTARAHAGGTRARRKIAKRAGRSGRPAPKDVYSFDSLGTDGDGSMRDLLGGKGANLAEMTSIGLPVPPGFTISTESCARYHEGGAAMPPGLMDEVASRLARLEGVMGKRFGNESDPLLVSVRSGAAVSMPGMMDTILNLGLNDHAVEGLGEASGDRRFAYDSYRRLIDMFGDVVMGVDREHFEHAFDGIKRGYGVTADNEVPVEGLIELCAAYKRVFRERTGREFPQDPRTQLELAIGAVFESWQSDKAVSYRRIEGVRGLLGTAVSVQAMVFGNLGEDCGTGVAFTRDPSTGTNEFFGEFLVNAQGEDVVAGIRTPRPVSEMPAWDRKAYRALIRIKSALEKHYRDVQDIEFTIERGTLFMLQTRTGKRTAAAAVKIACDMVKERLITRDEAVLRVPAEGLSQLLLPSFDPKAKGTASVLATGLPASPGAAVGRPAFTAVEAVERAQHGESVILVRRETSPEDVDGMHSAAGILTSTGGMTSHAAVVARGWGKCCVAGAGEIRIDARARTFSVGDRAFGPDDVISIDGSTGEVFVGAVERVEPEMSGDFATLMAWADKRRRLKVRANADTPEDARRARGLGAQGIGLTRTEHMFFDGDRIAIMREMILADSPVRRQGALDRLLPFQREDFAGLFEAMEGLPVTIRLLDPPLHEFLPNDEATQRTLAGTMGVPFETVRDRVVRLHELNPMLGHRGCRLAVTYPEILRMQVRAITEAALDCRARKIKAEPEIMIPLVGERRELALLRGMAEETIALVRKERGVRGRLTIRIGTMIEIPRAALTAGEIASEADFFSFGTNDLTQLVYGYSRDDSSSFLPEYIRRDILPADPFQTLDQTGVGQLVETCLRLGRAAKPALKVGICGEHGGDPASVGFFHRIGLEYVSCSPFRVPIARLAAAQAALRDS